MILSGDPNAMEALLSNFVRRNPWAFAVSIVASVVAGLAAVLAIPLLVLVHQFGPDFTTNEMLL